MAEKTPQQAIIGCILGTAVGDAVGLPYEGLSRRRAARLLGPVEGQRLLFGHGMVSDDTEHSCMVAQALIASGGDIQRFRHSLAWRFRLWLLALPAGVGMATARAILRLWVGFSPEHSGVFSAGNGPAMRAAILGTVLDDPQALGDWVRASTRITHTDPKAEYGALAVALAAQQGCRDQGLDPDRFVLQLQTTLAGGGEALLALITAAAESAKRGQSTQVFADSLGLGKGISGYVYHTVPVVLHACFVHPRDLRSAVSTVIACGGDADTTAAIVGGIVGAAVGKQGIPADWLDRLWEWPRTVAWMERLGEQLAVSFGTAGQCPVGLPVWGVLPRNLVFLGVVLLHGLRRLLPPY